MREKLERDALTRASGAVRLTEFEADHRSSFVNRLDQETTSFYFTNIPDEVQAVELWSLFAKHGRVGEVYMPKKRDKWGNRFGFVKFKDVKNVEALSNRLEDVWVGTFKIRINLSRFGRKSSKTTSNGRQPSMGQETVEADAKQHKPFKQALLLGRREKEPVVMPTVEVDVVPDFFHTLVGSYVGRLGVGVEVRALQTKLWLSGMPEVRVIAMGGELVLISNNSGEELRGLMCKKGWWGGLLLDIKRWTPNLVGSKRVLWINMSGIPLHAWGENTFRALANRYGMFLEVDVGTRSRRRLDMARVKIEASPWDRIDTVIKLVVQGATYSVRLVEEGGCGLDEEVGDDQLVDVGSSCASGGQAVAVVGFDDLDDVDTESDASDRCQRMDTSQAQKGSRSMQGKGECQGGSVNPKENSLLEYPLETRMETRGVGT
jgi:hypothetical protein